MSEREMQRVLGDVAAERRRQEALVAAGKFRETCASPSMSPALAFAVLGEEVGEVAREVVEAQSIDRLRAELVQVAAVAVAWIEGLDVLTRPGYRA